MPNLSSFWCVENPLKPLSTMNVVIPFDPLSGSVFAYTTSVDAMGPFVILACEIIHIQPRAETKTTSCALKIVPIQPPTPIGPLRPQSHADVVAPGPSLAHLQAAHLLPSNQVGQVPCLLLLRPVPVDLVHAQIG